MWCIDTLNAKYVPQWNINSLLADKVIYSKTKKQMNIYNNNFTWWLKKP